MCSHEDKVLRKDRHALMLADALAEGLLCLNDTALKVLCAGDTESRGLRGSGPILAD